MFATRDEADGMYANKDLFAVDESVQREALKNFYEQRAKVKIQDSNWNTYTTMIETWRIRRRSSEAPRARREAGAERDSRKRFTVCTIVRHLIPNQIQSGRLTILWISSIKCLLQNFKEISNRRKAWHFRNRSAPGHPNLKVIKDLRNLSRQMAQNRAKLLTLRPTKILASWIS